jgi:hypothetical protein
MFLESILGEVIKLKAVKRVRAERKVLCDSGFHKWAPLSERQFDVKQGKLVTVERCARCGAQRNRLT